MDLLSGNNVRVMGMLMMVMIPSIISGLQIAETTIQSPMRKYPIIFIILSVFFYVFVSVIPTWSTAKYPSDGFQYDYFLVLLLLYLLWTTLLYTFGQFIYSYIIIVLLLIVFVIPMKSIFKRKIHAGFSIMYLVAFLWVLYLFVYQTMSFFKGQY